MWTKHLIPNMKLVHGNTSLSSPKRWFWQMKNGHCAAMFVQISCVTKNDYKPCERRSIYQINLYMAIQAYNDPNGCFDRCKVDAMQPCLSKFQVQIQIIMKHLKETLNDKYETSIWQYKPTMTPKFVLTVARWPLCSHVCPNLICSYKPPERSYKYQIWTFYMVIQIYNAPKGQKLDEKWWCGGHVVLFVPTQKYLGKTCITLTR